MLYSGDMENVYIILQLIYSRNSVPNFVSIARVFWKEILQKKPFLWTQCTISSAKWANKKLFALTTRVF